MTRKIIEAVVILGILMIGASSVSAQDTGLLERSVNVGGSEYSYRVFVPKNWTRKKKWPTILFLHGAGERGSDNLRQTQVGLGPAISRVEATFPCVVVMPQCPLPRFWSEPEILAKAMAALDHSLAEFNGDKRRIYLTGLSMGGYGLWTMASAHPEKFAALAPVCGGVVPPPAVRVPSSMMANNTVDPYNATARRIGKKIPVWVFHGAADPVVPVSESRKMVEALKGIRSNVRYSEYEGVGHDSWNQAYAERDFLPWLLSQKR